MDQAIEGRERRVTAQPTPFSNKRLSNTLENPESFSMARAHSTRVDFPKKPPVEKDSKIKKLMRKQQEKQELEHERDVY